MFKKPRRIRRFFSFFALSAVCLVGAPILSHAQSNPGLTIFSGVSRDNVLSYYLDWGGRPSVKDRYKLTVPAKKMIPGVSRFIVKYPDYFYEQGGRFKADPERVEVRVNGKKDQSLAVRDVFWDKESHILEIDLEEPMEELRKVELVLHKVRNPRLGTYYFHCDVLASTDIPVRTYVGTWIIDIGSKR